MKENNDSDDDSSSSYRFSSSDENQAQETPDLSKIAELYENNKLENFQVPKANDYLKKIMNFIDLS